MEIFLKFFFLFFFSFKNSLLGESPRSLTFSKKERPFDRCRRLCGARPRRGASHLPAIFRERFRHKRKRRLTDLRFQDRDDTFTRKSGTYESLPFEKGQIRNTQDTIRKSIKVERANAGRRPCTRVCSRSSKCPPTRSRCRRPRTTPRCSAHGRTTTRARCLFFFKKRTASTRKYALKSYTLSKVIRSGKCVFLEEKEKNTKPKSPTRSGGEPSSS